MASLDDILTTQKNGVVAINAMNNILQRNEGTLTSDTVSGTTVIFTGAGKLVSISVITAGSAPGYVHNTTAVTSTATSNALVAVPNTIGVYACGQVFTNGLVIVPGAGQALNVTYSGA